MTKFNSITNLSKLSKYKSLKLSFLESSKFYILWKNKFINTNFISKILT